MQHLQVDLSQCVHFIEHLRNTLKLHQKNISKTKRNKAYHKDMLFNFYLAFTKLLPNGRKINLANLKYCFPKGIPIIVIQ